MTPDSSLDAPLDAFIERLADRVAVHVAAHLSLASQQPTISDEPVDESTMAGIAKVSAQSLARRRKANEIPYIQCGRRILYRPTDVLATLSAAKSGVVKNGPLEVSQGESEVRK